jgi:hypothetical protein
MRTLLCYSLILLSCLAEIPGALAGPPASPPAAQPAEIAVPAGQTLALVLTGRGVQIYECRAVAGAPGKFEWVFKAPEADLFDAGGRKVGRHFAGPAWVLDDGGKVVGRVKAKADAPDGQGVPWLLLEAVDATGGGVLGSVRSIQRVNTAGGKAPAEVPDASKVGQDIRVEYTATYKFYVATP